MHFLTRSVLRLVALTSLLHASLHAQDSTVYRGTQVSPEVERIYSRGLQFLAKAQSAEGTFPGNYGQEPATAALAILAMFAHGDDPNHGPYSKVIKRSLDFLLKSADEKTGYIGNSMYNHGFSSLALAEAYGAVQDDRIAPALQKAINLILSSQEKNRFKAWRYTPEAQDADSTVSGACFVALIAARNAGLRVPDKAIEGALKFYSDCQVPGGGAIGYVPGSGGNGNSTTAIGVTAYAYARKKELPTYVRGFKALKDGDERPGGSYPFYYEYYAAQAFFQSDVQLWEKWNAKRVKELASLQNEDGSWDGGLGSGISTSLGLLSIALNYRYLPIYER